MAFRLCRVFPLHQVFKTSFKALFPSRKIPNQISMLTCNMKQSSCYVPLQCGVSQPYLRLQRQVPSSRGFFHGPSALWAKSSWFSFKKKENQLNFRAEAMEGLKNFVFGPPSAIILGLAGLVPFVYPPFAMMTSCYSPFMAQAQTLYGAAILSFLGGVRWGAAIAVGGQLKPGWCMLIKAVVPSLVAWTALMFPLPVSTLVVAGGLTAAGYQDVARPGYPYWFKGLRLILTTVAVVALILVPLCRIVYPGMECEKALVQPAGPTQNSQPCSPKEVEPPSPCGTEEE